LRGRTDIPILLLTAKGETADRIAGLEAGCDDYLVKPFEPRELLLRIATILKRAAPAGESESVSFGAFRFEFAHGELFEDDRPVYLTTGEVALLAVLAERFGSPVSRYELARRAGIEGSERAVDVQMTRLRRKIEKDPRQPMHLQTVRGEGYVLRPGS
jgi:two-component system phosphate regulon response regulator OmpR